MQKILPKTISNCGECPYYHPHYEVGCGNCSLLIVKGYTGIFCYASCLSEDCPLENYREWSEEKMR